MSARGSLQKQQPIEHPLIYGDFGGRVRKDIGYVRHYIPEFRADLESGDLIMITDQNSNVQFYIVDPRTKPVVMPERKIPVFTKWSTGIPILVGGVAPASSNFEVAEMAMGYGEIGIWKVYAKTPNFQFTIDQPALQNPVFTDGTRAIWMDYQNTGTYAKSGDWGHVPEIVTFEQETPVFLNVVSENMNEVGWGGYVAYTGFRYKLIKTLVPEPSDEPRVVRTLQLGSLK